VSQITVRGHSSESVSVVPRIVPVVRFDCKWYRKHSRPTNSTRPGPKGRKRLTIEAGAYPDGRVVAFPTRPHVEDEKSTGRRRTLIKVIDAYRDNGSPGKRQTESAI